MNPFNSGYWTSDELREFGFSVGRNVLIAKQCTIVGRDGGFSNISIGDNVRIDPYTSIIAASGELKLGSYIHIGSYSMLSCVDAVVMEDFSGLSQGVRIYSATDDYTGEHLTNPTVPKQYLGVHAAPVRLGRHVIVGSGSVILPGVNIDEGASVGALSLVTKSLPAWGIYVGAPARLIKARSRALLMKEAELIAQGRER